MSLYWDDVSKPVKLTVRPGVYTYIIKCFPRGHIVGVTCRRRHPAVRAGPSPLPRRSARLPGIVVEPSLTEESAREGRHGSTRKVTGCPVAFTLTSLRESHGLPHAALHRSYR